MSTYRIAVIPGDGIGPEIVAEAIKVLNKVGDKFGHTFEYTYRLMGGAAYDAVGTCFPEDTVEVCQKHDAVLLGAVGGPKWDNLPGAERPEKALLKIREGLGLYANLRPAIMHKALAKACPIKPENIGESMDLMIVRELTGGIYFGEHGWRDGKYGPEAYDVERYSEMEIRRIAKVAFNAAMARDKNLVSVDKANVLEASRLWRKIVTEMAADYPEVTVSHMYVDNAAMQLVRNPKQFDVMVTENTFGDILTDEMAIVCGSLGMLPSASLSHGSNTFFGLYEPSGGSAPDIAGKGIANPIAQILSMGMLLRYTCKETAAADAVDAAVRKVIAAGYRTGDLATGAEGEIRVGTRGMGDAIIAAL